MYGPLNDITGLPHNNQTPTQQKRTQTEINNISNK